MPVFLYNVAGAVLELLLPTYFTWLDPFRYLDVSRSALLARDGYLKIKRRVGPISLPIVWHAGAHSSPLSLFVLCLSAAVFLVNQGAFDVATRDATSPAMVLTCHANAKIGKMGLLNSRAGLAHLYRTETGRSGAKGHPAPRWADAKLENDRIMYGTATYLCRYSFSPEILKDVNYCFDGDYAGGRRTGNMVTGKTCDPSLDGNITRSGIEKSSPDVLCTNLLSPTERLFWVGNRPKGVKISGITAAPSPSSLRFFARKSVARWTPRPLCATVHTATGASPGGCETG